MRYHVLIASDGPPLEITYRELHSARELREGDEIFLDERPVTVQSVLSPNDARHDAEIICRPAYG